MAWADAGSRVVHSSLPVAVSKARKRRSVVAPMNVTPLAVTGKPVELGPKTTSLPVTRVTRDAGQFLQALAAVLGVREGGGLDLQGALHGWMTGRKALLLLDNLEQVVAAAPDIAGLLAAAPQVQILATSRIRLGIGAERLLPIEPLLGALADDAMQLFAQRAQQVLEGRLQFVDRHGSPNPLDCVQQKKMHTP